MPTASNVVKRPETRELIIERVMPAPREAVWKAWTVKERLERWWGPHQWKATIYELDLRLGGLWRYSLTPEDSSTAGGRGKATYKEIEESARLVYVDSFADENWETVPGSEMTTTVTFEEVTGGTKLTIATQFASVEDMERQESMGMVDGLIEAFDRLEDFVNPKKGN